MPARTARGAGLLAGAVIGAAIWFAIDAARTLDTAATAVDNIRQLLNTAFPDQFPAPTPIPETARTFQVAAAIAAGGLAYYLIAEGA